MPVPGMTDGVCMRSMLPGFLRVAAAIVLLMAPVAAQNAAFPDKEIKVLIGFGAGSSTETSLRALGQVAEKYLKKSIIVVDKPGASQAIAMS